MEGKITPGSRVCRVCNVCMFAAAPPYSPLGGPSEVKKTTRGVTYCIHSYKYIYNIEIYTFSCLVPCLVPVQTFTYKIGLGHVPENSTFVPRVWDKPEPPVGQAWDKPGMTLGQSILMFLQSMGQMWNNPNPSDFARCGVPVCRFDDESTLNALGQDVHHFAGIVPAADMLLHLAPGD